MDGRTKPTWTYLGVSESHCLVLGGRLSGTTQKPKTHKRPTSTKQWLQDFCGHGWPHQAYMDVLAACPKAIV